MNIELLKILKDKSIKEALEVIENGSLKIAFVVDENNILLGSISDGDVRRAFLKGIGVDSPILDLFNNSPIVANISEFEDNLKRICIESEDQIDTIPLIDDKGRLVDIYCFGSEYLPKAHNNTVVLMVGGLGSRLRPLTENTPKPMLNVGGKPILETIVKGFSDNGFTNITMCLGYKSDVIKDHFQDGSDFGVNINYILENKRMGTAGALTLLDKKLDEPFFVMNGDLLTNVNFDKMLDFHKENNSKATMCVREYDIEVPYGVVNIVNEQISSIEEKPVHKFFVNAGIYLLEPECIDLVPNNEFYDMPTLFSKLIDAKEKTTSFPLREYWLDIGRISDYEKAELEYYNVFKEEL